MTIHTIHALRNKYLDDYVYADMRGDTDEVRRIQGSLDACTDIIMAEARRVRKTRWLPKFIKARRIDALIGEWKVT